MKNLNERVYNACRSPSKALDYIQSKLFYTKYQKETSNFIQNLKQNVSNIYEPYEKIKLNKLCCIEDWENKEIITTIPKFHKEDSPIFIHRKDWELALGLIAMQRLGKLNEDSVALGVGSGKEPIIFYLANKIKHVYATDLYTGTNWQEAAPMDFPSNPSKYAPFPYRKDALTVLRMDGRKLEFPSNKFDIVFSFSSIEHFGEKNHLGALRSLKEMERVLKIGGIAVIATEFIINDKEHSEYFNRKTIYSELIDKVNYLSLVEPLDLKISSKTLDSVIDYFSVAFDWTYQDDQYKKAHPHVMLRLKNMLFTSLMLVFQKNS